ncbi:Uncharacterised protein [Mycobacterium tuberculosis]|nr:Uncharacterised protein [Mycobacterium tuberculosis]
MTLSFLSEMRLINWVKNEVNNATKVLIAAGLSPTVAAPSGSFTRVVEA